MPSCETMRKGKIRRVQLQRSKGKEVIPPEGM